MTNALTSFRQKGFDPYAEAKTGPANGTNVVSAAVTPPTPLLLIKVNSIRRDQIITLATILEGS